MAASLVAPLISIADYLHHIPDPDVDYVDGTLEERNLGEYDHGDLQGELVTLFRNHRESWQIRTVPEARVQVASTRYRIPDVCVMPLAWQRTRIIREAPLLCIEVKSAGFTLQREIARAQDYLHMGTPAVWIVDPETRTIHTLTLTETSTQRDGILRLANSAIELDIAALFQVLDE